MNYYQIFEELKEDTEDYLIEGYEIKKVKNKFKVVDKKGTPVKGTRKEGYLSLENAVRNMFSYTLPSSKFDDLNFVKKKAKIDGYITKFEIKNKIKTKMKTKFGFKEFVSEQ